MVSKIIYNCVIISSFKEMMFNLCRVPLVAKAYIAPIIDTTKSCSSGTSSTEANGNGVEICARCGGTVFLAERKQAAGKVRL